MDEAYLKVLQMIQDGTITAEAGEKLLDALEGESGLDGQGENGILLDRRAMFDEAETLPSGPPVWFHRIWVYLLASGASVLGLAGIATVLVLQGGGFPGWLACTLPLMVFGALVVALTWWSRTARWLRVQVRDVDARINLSLPLPLRPAAWLARLSRPWVPILRDVAVDELILSLAEIDDEGILAVEVRENEGEEVQVYFG